LPGRREKRNLIIPVFIPNQGCPYQCVYCHQEKITNQSGTPVNASSISHILDTALAYPGFNNIQRREIAFFGGTFTRLGSDRMIELLEAAAPYLQNGSFHSIRISTRPDEIDKRRLELLKRYNVATVELGIQSMDNEVLKRSGRGHSTEDTIKAINLLGEYGFNIGAQLMPGLPGDSEEKFQNTIDKILDIKPHIARLYPAIVIKGTVLERWYRDGRYKPLTLEKAVRICGESCNLLEKNGIKVIRIGLMSSPSLLRKGQIVAGPWHRSFGFLVRSNMHLDRIMPLLPKPGEAKRIGIRTTPREIPLTRGFKNQGLRTIEEKCKVKIAYVKPDNSVPSGRIEVDVIR
jgi:histone acetyltransferase (RNA polymerase elongator complex component)